MITLTRNGLMLSISEGMFPARGSQNVPVRYVNDIDEYANYLITPVVGWTERNGLPKSSIAEYSDGIIKLPARVFAQSCMASIAIKMTDSSDPTHVEVTYPQSFFIEKAPDGTLILPPTDEEWKQYIDDFVTQYFNQNIDPEMDEFQAEIIQRQNIYETQLSQNQADFEEQINTDFDNFIERVDGNPEALYRGYLISKNNVYSGIASNDGINLGKVVGKSIQNGTPTPDSPVEIENVNITKLYSHTRNLFDASKLPTTSQGGATITNNGDGSFTISGSGNTTNQILHQYIYTNEETRKILKAGTVMRNSYSATTPDFIFGLVPKDTSSYITNKRIDNILSSFTVTEQDLVDCRLKVVFYSASGAKIVTGTIKPMLYQDGDGTYEPFQFNEVSTSLKLAQDDVYENNKIIRDRKQVLFDGSSDENWIWSASNGIPYIQLQDAKPSSLPKCNKVKSYIVIGTDYQEGITINGTGKLSVNITDEMYPDKNWNDADTWKTWLQSNPITVEYELATPITEYVDVPTIPSYYPNTVASHNSVVEPTEIEWHVNTDGVTTVTGANNEPLKEVPMTPPQDELVNSDFQINQRGQASYNFNTNGKYGLDCWQHRQGAYYGAIVVEPLEGGGIKTTLNSQTGAGIRQYVKRDSSVIGKKRTTLIKVDDIECTGTVTLSESVQSIVENDIFKLEVWYDNTTQSIVYSLWYNRDTETHPTSEVHYIHYAHMWPGSIAYKHVQEDKAIALMRVRQYVFVTVQKKLVAKAGTAHLEGFDFPIAMKATPIYDVIAFEATNGTDKRSELLGISCTSRGVSYMTLQSPTQEEYQYTILFSCEQLG